METVFFDEAGYTGIDYFNKEQPVFCLASIRISEEQSKLLKQRLFHGIQAPELKHVSLQKSNKGRRKTLRFIRHVAANSNMGKVYVAHKEFIIITKFIDYIIENYCHNRDVNLYKGKYCLYLANYFYHTVKEKMGEVFFNSFSRSFVEMMKNPSLENRKNLISKCRLATGIPMLDNLLMASSTFIAGKESEELWKERTEKFLHIEASLAEWLAISWGQVVGGGFRVVHDESRGMKEIMPYWESIMSANIPETKVGYGKDVNHFPIRVQQTIIADSKDWIGLQLADVVAGALARLFKMLYFDQNSEDDYAIQLRDAEAEKLVSNVIWPNPRLDDSINHDHFLESDAEDPLEFTCKIVQKVNEREKVSR